MLRQMRATLHSGVQPLKFALTLDGQVCRVVSRAPRRMQEINSSMLLMIRVLVQAPSRILTTGHCSLVLDPGEAQVRCAMAEVYSRSLTKGCELVQQERL